MAKGASPAQLLCHTLPPILAYRIGRFFISREQRGQSPFVTRTITGAIYAHRRGDILADTIRICGFWDWRNLALAEVFCQRGDHIAEVGANTGTETLGFADIVGPRGRVTAFEPDVKNMDVLVHNVHLNNYRHVVLKSVAVTDKSGSVDFVPAEVETNCGTGYVRTAGSTRDAVTVPALAVDSMAEELGDVKFVCVDVEGLEIPVLRGARVLLARQRPIVVVEANAKELMRAGYDLRALRGELAAQGYVPFEIMRFDVRPAIVDDATNPLYYRNWLCLPFERVRERRRVRSAFLRWGCMPRAGYLRTWVRGRRADGEPTGGDAPPATVSARSGLDR